MDKILIRFVLIPILLVLIAVLVAKIRQVKKESEEDKVTDSETGIGNLQFFKYHFKYTIGDILRSTYYVAYIVLDIASLRADRSGISFADALKYAASVLSECTDDGSFSARITENGFAFAFRSETEEEAQKRFNELMNKLNAFDGIRDKRGKLACYAAVYPLSEADRNCELLLFNLRKNCNRIFGTEKQVIFCDKNSMNSVQEEKQITESILKGFENNEFKMYLQFVVDNKTKKIVSAEALSRWNSVDKGLQSPAMYIENMEMVGLISKLDFYMFELVCRQLEKWKDTECKDISISCNFTRITLSEESFVDNLTAISSKYEFDNSKLVIEITEDAMEKDRNLAMENVAKCKELGFNVYLDDLGSGYTSLINLCDYPIDVVKIDRDILLKTETKKGRDLFLGIIALAHSLNIKVICEGVETKEQNEFVSESDCDYIQGWYYSKPLPLEECEPFMERFDAR